MGALHQFGDLLQLRLEFLPFLMKKFVLRTRTGGLVEDVQTGAEIGFAGDPAGDAAPVILFALITTSGDVFAESADIGILRALFAKAFT